MEILDSSESLLHWDRNLSELSEADVEAGDMDCTLYTNHFSELLDELSHDALLGQLLSDPFLSGARGRRDGGRGGHGDDDDDDADDLRASSLSPHIAAEHSYSLCGDSRPQSPLSHLTGERGSDAESEGDSSEWPMEQDVDTEALLCHAADAEAGPPRSPLVKIETEEEEEQLVFPEIKLEPHQVDQFLNLSPKGLEALRMPPTPPSSHESDSEGSQSPSRALPGLSHPPSPSPAQPKASPRGSSSLSNSPLLTAAHKLQGSGPLMLTEEERRTLVAEGYPVPTKLPLSKAEEKALKKIRRKIKNKISAQESRRKKKEYMDTLEKKVETCSNENGDLRRKVDTLECTNKSLLQQLQALQALLSGKVSKSCRAAGTQTSSCLMVLVLCFALFLGSFYPPGLASNSGPPDSGLASGRPAPTESYAATAVKSRSLLSTFEDEPPPVPGLGGEYPHRWEDPAGAVVVMAAWRRQRQHRREMPAESAGAETRPPFWSKGNQSAPDDDIFRSLEQRATSRIALESRVKETS